LCKNIEIESILPFFILENPFKKFLIKLSQSDGRVDSIFNKLSIGKSLSDDILNELIENDIIYIVNSRETLPNHKLEKRFAHYKVQSKIFFKEPFYRFWFAFVEPNRDKYGNININLVLENYKKYGYKLSSLIFEQISIELLRSHFNIDSNVVCASYWDRELNEFDIYCQMKNKTVIGECKYSDRLVTKTELTKLQKKIEDANLNANTIAFFSKSGYSNELKKMQNSNLLLFEIDDFYTILR